MLAGFIPISIAVAIAMVPHLLVKVGMDVPPFFLAPVFALWAIFSGIVVSGCIFFRQFVLGAFIVFLSFLALCFVYIWYVL